MKTRALIGASALAATVAGVGVAHAAPHVTSIEANRVGKGRIEVVVQVDRGTDAAPPTVAVRVRNGGRRAARALNAAQASQATDAVTYVARFRGGRRAYAGTKLAVGVKACDSTGCNTDSPTVSVMKTTPIAVRIKGDAPSTPLPDGAVDSTTAVKVALVAVGDGSTLLAVERADELSAAWAVKVLRADGARVKVYVAADGTVVATRVEAPAASGRENHPEDHQPPAPIPGAVTMDQAIAVALAYAGDGSVLLQAKAEDGPQVAFEVKVQKADGTRWELKIAPDGSVVRAAIDH